MLLLLLLPQEAQLLQLQQLPLCSGLQPRAGPLMDLKNARPARRLTMLLPLTAGQQTQRLQRLPATQQR